MKRLNCCEAIAAVALTSLPLLADPIPIYELPTASLPDVRDGSLSEWTDLVPGPSLMTGDFQDLATGEPMENADSVAVYLGWNGEHARIYVGLLRRDDVYINTYAGVDSGDDMYLHDSVELMVDGDRSGGDYSTDSAGPQPDPDVDEEAYYAWVERVLLAGDSQAQKYQAICAAPDGRQLRLAGPPDVWMPWATLPPFGDGSGGAVGSSDETTVLEFYVTAWDTLNYHGPEHSHASQLRAGGVIGFQLAILDYDQRSWNWDGWYTIDGAPPADRSSTPWLEAVLLARDPDAPASAVAPASWSWVKATVGGRGRGR